jgi:hypothetical protein
MDSKKDAVPNRSSTYNPNGMRTKGKQGPEDINEIALRVVHAALDDDDIPTALIEREKNPAAVELGRLGGLKGGKSRANKLSAEERSAIAKKAAAARWKNKPPSAS